MLAGRTLPVLPETEALSCIAASLAGREDLLEVMVCIRAIPIPLL